MGTLPKVINIFSNVACVCIQERKSRIRKGPVFVLGLRSTKSLFEKIWRLLAHCFAITFEVNNAFQVLLLL